MSTNAIDSPEAAPNIAQNNISQTTQPPASHSDPPSRDKLSNLVAALGTDNLKKQFIAIRELSELGAEGEQGLVSFVRDCMATQNPEEPTAAHGSAYQYLYQAASANAKDLVAEFPNGLVCPQSDKGIDYSDLQRLLIEKKYEAADKVTNQKLCQLAGNQAIERKWVYFTEVSQFPILDLRAIDILWGLYSENKFGWSKQREIWLRLGKNWERLWPQLMWKTENTWTRYPNEFIWDLSAPVGHLPLSNQLRGVRTMSSLLSHPAWDQ